ncbi:MAG TPA: galactokinase [Acidobacteriaceae bacterium]
MPPTHEFVAPARVNLIGEHTDYTGGLVLPMAIPFTTVATLTPMQDGMYRFRSESFPAHREMSLADRGERIGNWSDYPVGVLRELQALGIQPPPFELALRGNIPLGSGLSSSASLEVVTAFALLAHSHAALSKPEIATLCRRAENGYVGSPCGIMDQFVVTAAEADHALLLDTRTLDSRAVPLNRGDLAGISVVVCNSMVRHSIAAGDYGVRRIEVEAGQRALQSVMPQLRDLGEATLADLERHKDLMSAESFRRCRHIITENGRVRATEAALLEGSVRKTGALLLEAHASQRDDFECSVEEIDFLVDTAAGLQGCFGARMTGGGFGGCTVNLVTNSEVESFIASLTSAYRARFGVDAETYVCTAVAGAWQRNVDQLPWVPSVAPGGEKA